MSLILEALRRSEAERRRGQVPDLLAPGPVVRRNSRSRFLVPLLTLVLGMVLAAAAARLWWPSPASVLTSSVAPASSVVAAPVVAAPVVATAPVAPAVPMPPPALARPFESKEGFGTPDDQTVAPPSEAPATTVTSTPTETRSVEPLRMEVAMLSPNERSALPPLRISMHVFHEEPARRFAIVDGQRLREGDALAAGLSLKSIERDGLQLEWQGRALWLPR
jgi:general secretion pathway protein B